MGEKTLHAVLKEHFEPDASCHEKKVGSLIADIVNGTVERVGKQGNMHVYKRKVS